MILPEPLTIRIAPAVGALLLAGGAAGCAAGPDPAEADPDARQLEAPVTVSHQFDTVEISAIPERIVTIDLQWTDAMLAMGVEPVGYTADPYLPDSGVPWQEPPAGAEALPLADGVPIDRVAQLEPDLILGSYSIADQQTYQLLSGIAPTIATLDEQRVTPWQDLVRLAGELLADPQTAEQVITDVEDAVAATAAELPGLAGQTFALAQYIVGDAMYIVADEQDGSSVFFQQLGMQLYPPVQREGEAAGQARVNVSPERADLLRADLLAFLVNGGDERDLADIPGFDQLPGTVAVLDYPTIVALNTPTPLSLPYAINALRLYLQEAAAGAAGS